MRRGWISPNRAELFYLFSPQNPTPKITISVTFTVTLHNHRTHRGNRRSHLHIHNTNTFEEIDPRNSYHAIFNHFLTLNHTTNFVQQQTWIINAKLSLNPKLKFTKLCTRETSQQYFGHFLTHWFCIFYARKYILYFYIAKLLIKYDS